MELIVRTEGSITETNFPEYKEYMIERIESIHTDLETYSDYKQASVDIKALATAEKVITDAVQGIVDQTASIHDLYEAMDEVVGKIKSVKKTLTDQVQEWKKREKDEIVEAGFKAIGDALASSGAHLAALDGFKFNRERFPEAVKRKKNTTTMRESITVLVNKIMEEFGVYRTRIDDNEQILSTHISKYPSLFPDQNKLLQMESDALEEVINARIATHKAQIETAKIEAEAKEKERIRAEEEKRIRAEEEKRIRAEEEAQNVVEPEIKKPIGENPTDTTHDAPVQSPSTHHNQDIRYSLTVILSCSRNDAVEITKTVHAALEPFGGDKVISVNLDKDS